MPLVGEEPSSKKLGLLFGTSPLAFNGLPVIAIDFGRALLRISPSMSISRDASPPGRKKRSSSSEFSKINLENDKINRILLQVHDNQFDMT